jgi:hypothetical protein
MANLPFEKQSELFSIDETYKERDNIGERGVGWDRGWMGQRGFM